MKKYPLLVVVVISLLVAFGGCCAPQAEVTTAPAAPYLIVLAASSTSVVHPGEWFDIEVTVENRGQGKAEDVHIYMEPSATGYALAEDCNYWMEAIAPAGLKIHVGDVFPGDTDVVRIECKATDKAQYEPQSVTENFYYDYYGGAKVWAYSIIISFSTGGVPFAPPPS